MEAGRFQVGPWYVMPDEFLPCGESLVRNLLRGHQAAGEFGTPMKVGFVCDIFGHNSQLPQVFRGFGIDTAVGWRGTNFPEQPGLFRWQAADGNEVLTYAFEDRGYGHYWFEVRVPSQTPSATVDCACRVRPGSPRTRISRTARSTWSSGRSRCGPSDGNSTSWSWRRSRSTALPPSTTGSAGWR